ncbi:hypothetical protein Anapl_09368 [Anas platyrhynchos]|uniref:Uncharacterized protein n=1 Tax=Anas platyrhynchos TaxID=8839 RepID=R0LPE4_ANAPL|nr:hypothetical protein Anapl_09368 [Anas platyrhynchos]
MQAPQRTPLHGTRTHPLHGSRGSKHSSKLLPLVGRRLKTTFSKRKGTGRAPKKPTWVIPAVTELSITASIYGLCQHWNNATPSSKIQKALEGDNPTRILFKQTCLQTKLMSRQGQESSGKKIEGNIILRSLGSFRDERGASTAGSDKLQQVRSILANAQRSVTFTAPSQRMHPASQPNKASHTDHRVSIVLLQQHQPFVNPPQQLLQVFIVVPSAPFQAAEQQNLGKDKLYFEAIPEQDFPSPCALQAGMPEPWDVHTLLRHQLPLTLRPQQQGVTASVCTCLKISVTPPVEGQFFTPSEGHLAYNRCRAWCIHTVYLQRQLTRRMLLAAAGGSSLAVAKTSTGAAPKISSAWGLRAAGEAPGKRPGAQLAHQTHRVQPPRAELPPVGPDPALRFDPSQQAVNAAHPCCELHVRCFLPRAMGSVHGEAETKPRASAPRKSHLLRDRNRRGEAFNGKCGENRKQESKSPVSTFHRQYPGKQQARQGGQPRAFIPCIPVTHQSLRTNAQFGHWKRSSKQQGTLQTPKSYLMTSSISGRVSPWQITAITEVAPSELAASNQSRASHRYIHWFHLNATLHQVLLANSEGLAVKPLTPGSTAPLLAQRYTERGKQQGLGNTQTPAPRQMLYNLIAFPVLPITPQSFIPVCIPPTACSRRELTMHRPLASACSSVKSNTMRCPLLAQQGARASRSHFCHIPLNNLDVRIKLAFSSRLLLLNTKSRYQSDGGTSFFIVLIPLGFPLAVLPSTAFCNFSAQTYPESSTNTPADSVLAVLTAHAHCCSKMCLASGESGKRLKARGLSARLCPQQLLRNSAQPPRAPAAGDIAQETTGSAARPEISKNEKHPSSLQRMRVNRAKDEGGEIKGIVLLAAGSPRRWDGTRTALLCKSPPWVLGAFHTMLSHDAAPGATKTAPLGKASSSPHDGFFPSNKSYFCCLASRNILSPAAVRALPPPAERELCEIRDPGYWVADEASLPNPFSQTDPAVAFLALLLSGFVSWHVPIPSWEV